MNKTSAAMCACAVMVSSHAFGDSHYMICFGGGRLGLYYSAVFPESTGAKSNDTADAFSKFVKSKYGTTISAECHTDLTQANAESDKKIREDSDQNSKFPSKLIETGWSGG
jgi:hypothetical protein